MAENPSLLYETTILDLNYDCLDLIFQRFELDDILHLYNEVHSRFNEAIERQMYRFRHYEFNMRFPPHYDEAKLKILGSQLHSLYINVGYSTSAKEVIPLLLPLCQGAAETQRLRALKLEHAGFTPEYVRAVKLVTPFLRILDLSSCDVRDRMIIELLERAEKLQHLVLLNIYNLTGEKHLKQKIFNRISTLRLVCIMIIGLELPYNPEDLSKQFPKLSFLIYDKIDCKTFKIYGPAVNVQLTNKWYHEYFSEN